MKIVIFLFLILFTSHSFSQDLFDPKNTKIVIAGVLKWQDPKISTFSNHHRKDQELYDQFISMGVPKENIVILLDEKATLKAMQKNIVEKMSAGDENSTFIFYYAGHGVKSGDKYYFCNYDMGNKIETQFDVSFLNENVKKFKGKRMILLADCCYSGSLLKVGEDISKSTKEVIVMSSSTSSNISTGNWTYTQTLLDNLYGLSQGDRDKNGEISLKELSNEIKDAMKFRERQLNGFAVYGVEEDKITVQKLKSGEIKSDLSENNLTIDQYVYAYDKGDWKPARIKKLQGRNITVEFYDYSDKREVVLAMKQIHTIETPDYSDLKKIEVDWEGKFFGATIKKVDGDFYFIQYDGYDETWNEWVMYDRIKTGNEKKSSIEWGGAWYDGVILQEKNKKYFVTYKGYKHTWDEWVNKDRIK